MNSASFRSAFFALLMSILFNNVFSRPIGSCRNRVGKLTWTSDEAGDDQTMVRSNEMRRLAGRDDATDRVADTAGIRTNPLCGALADDPPTDGCRYCDGAELCEEEPETADNRAESLRVMVGVLVVLLLMVSLACLTCAFRHCPEYRCADGSKQSSASSCGRGTARRVKNRTP